MSVQLLRGDVVACKGRYFVVWSSSRQTVEAFPILLGAAEASAEHVVVAGDELASWRVSELSAAVSVMATVPLSAHPSLSIIRVGRCSGGLICRIVGAAVRAYAAENVVQTGRGECNNNKVGSTGFRAA